MKRRSFLKNTGIGAIGTYYLPLFLTNSEKLLAGRATNKLIIIQLSGGNDGLNTVIPFEDDLYYNARPVIGIKKNKVIKSSDYLGLNPAMESFAKLYDEGIVSIINSVGYPNPSRSHFRSMDIWQTASKSNQYLTSGWIGRYLDAYCDNNHAALEIDSQLSLALQGNNNNGLAVNNSSTLYQALKGRHFNKLIKQSEEAELDEDNMGYLYKTLVSTNQSAGYIKETHTIKDNNFGFPKSALGKKLATVSQFVRSGLSTEIYYVSHNGFDSHTNQRRQQDRLLKEYSDGVYSLVKSLEKSGHLDNTLILTFSEFGRRVSENASAGTDHGKANNVFVIGKNLTKQGFYNSGPDLANLDEGDVRYQIDFRNIYADILKYWLHKDPKKIMTHSFESLGIIT
jgi:uncharacterized protein (DUF1501 family)